MLLENGDLTYPAFASHNSRSLAHALTLADSHQRRPCDYEVQLLYGMAHRERGSLLAAGYQVRVYSSIGEAISRIAYLVRRSLDNISSQEFLRFSEKEGERVEVLLQAPQAPQRAANSR